ncbi:hypothetical protein BRADI_2g02626v3 [Brachypodium distachyon]|uniref:Uncharacterized protein n=1 Tax=Brachypodium distachyon TaxID=15368 RepID=I1HBU3_BRADI|nr:hypothetical protein BRADI_2g02626v3 [Brachypodium distachyon]
MRPFYKMILLALALAALCSSDVAARNAMESGGALIPPEDCRQTPVVPGPCDPKDCFHGCRANLGPGSVGECIPEGCLCTYCIPPQL